ncbi:MAG: CHC2 zinc finger domain-containing protein [Chloroflexota bacterium]
MTIDTQTLKHAYDLRILVEQDLGPSPVRSGRAHLYKCPFHNEQKGFSLAVWSDGYRCFGKCDLHGDHLDWLTAYRHLSFGEALTVLGAPPPDVVPRQMPQRGRSSEPPDPEWQTAAAAVVDLAEETLWSPEGESALTYLLERGLTTRTIQRARLGYIPGDYRGWRTLHGLDVPCGITIPWFASNDLYTVKVRRAYGHPKYTQIAGGTTAGLFNADSLPPADIVLFCEGEFDALLASQELGNLATAVTLGSAANVIPDRWLLELVTRDRVLVAFDRDAAGAKGAKRLLKHSSRFKALALPAGNDITDYYLRGGDLYTWVAASLSEAVCDAS